MSNPIADLINAGQLQMVSYSNANYRYRCFAIPGTPLATANWHVRREKLDGTETLFPKSLTSDLATADYCFAATSLEVVAAYSYDLPA